MQSGTENIGASTLDDLVLDSITGLSEDIEASTPDDFDSPNLIRGLRFAIPISLALWAVIILALVKLF